MGCVSFEGDLFLDSLHFLLVFLGFAPFCVGPFRKGRALLRAIDKFFAFGEEVDDDLFLFAVEDVPHEFIDPVYPVLSQYGVVHVAEGLVLSDEVVEAVEGVAEALESFSVGGH
jgi:hypothetical protein